MLYLQSQVQNRPPSTKSDPTVEVQRLPTAEHIRSWKRDGFLVIRAQEWLTAAEVKQLQSWMQEVQDWPEKAFHWMKYFEESSKDNSTLLNRVENFIPYHSGLNGWFNGSKTFSILEPLMGGEVVLYKDKINMKLPGGGGFEPHQDIAAGWGSYGDGKMNFVTLSVSMDHAHARNGALKCVAGKHKEGKFGNDWEPLSEKLVDSMKWEMIETFPGDMVIFDAFVPHRSDPNNADMARRNFYLTYNLKQDGDYRDQYFIDKRKGYPPDIERETGKLYKYKV